MMGLGSLGNGGPSASSPSSLSPLAPPFTVDRSNQKSNSSQLLQFSELHSMYATPFDNKWACPNPLTSTPLSTSLLDDTDSIRITCLPLSNDYHFLASESVNPPGAHWPTSNPMDQYMTNAFLYSCDSTPYSCQDVSPAVNDAHRIGAHWPNSNPTGQPMTNAFLYSCDSTLYSRQDVSPAVNDITHAVSINQPKYDMSPTLGIVCTNMSSPLAYTGRFSGLEYTSQWGSFWNGLAGENQGKLIELEGSVCLDESCVSDSLGYNNNAKKGIHTADGVTQHEKVSAAVSQGKHSDAFGSENYPMSMNAMQLDDKLLLEQDISLIPFASSRTLTSRTHSAIPYSHPKAPSLDSVTNTSQYVPYEKCFELLDSIATNCISSTSSTLVIRPPATGTISSPPTIFSSKTIDTVSVDTGKSRGSDSQNFSKEKDPVILQNTDYKEGCFDARGLSSHKERNNHKNATSSSIIGEQSNKQHTVSSLYHAIEDKSGFQGPDLSIAADFSLTIDSGIDYTENSTDSLDHLNTGVDSPCWKGAPEWHFSPFEVAIPQLFTNRLEACNTLNLQGTQTFPSHSQPMNFSLQRQCENNNLNEKSCAEDCFSMSQKRCSDAIETAKVHRSSDVEESRNSNIKGVQFCESIEKYSNFSFISEPKNDSEPSHFRKLGLEEGDSTSSKVKKTQDDVAEDGIKTTDFTEACHFPAVKNVSCLLSFEEDTADFATPRSRESTPKMDAQMLVQTMCNLSELLRFHCSVNSRPLEGHEHETLEIVMDNLRACMSKKIVDVISVPESIVSEKGTHCDSSPDQCMGPSIGQSQITNKAPAISIGQQEKYNASGKKTEKFTSYVSLKNETEVPKFDCMVKAIKAVLDEDFQSEEKVESQSSPLYKNLWLEAEAELCSINYRTRLDRMKIEMKKSKLKKEKENNITEDKILSSSISAYPSVSYALAAKTKHGRLPFETAGKESTHSGTTSHIDEEEASVMARLRILTCRGKNSKSIDMEEQVPTVVNTGTVGERCQIPFMGGDELGDMKAVAKPCQQHEQESIKEFRICINDNGQMVPFARNNAQPIQDTSSCCYDNTTSDWEHVLKDDYALQ